jgi:hypothetical protein
MARLHISILLLFYCLCSNASGQPSTVQQRAEKSNCANIVALTGNVNLNCSNLTSAQKKAISNIPAILQMALENKDYLEYIKNKLDEISKNTLGPGPVIGSISQGSGSALSFNQQGGVTAGVYMATPDPQISFTVDDSTPQLDATHPRQCIKISIDRLMDSPQFAVICDHACKAVGAGVISPSGGAFGGDRFGSILGHPDVAAFIVGQPNPMPSNVKFAACMESEDNMPLKILDVKKLILKGDKK